MTVVAQHQLRRRWFFHVIVGFVVVALMLGQPLSATKAQDQSDAVANSETAPVDVASDADVEPESDAEKRDELKQWSALTGLLILALLCIVFLTLMIGVILWARRIRRMTSKSLPEQHPGDPLWYLRKPAAKSGDVERGD